MILHLEGLQEVHIKNIGMLSHVDGPGEVLASTQQGCILLRCRFTADRYNIPREEVTNVSSTPGQDILIVEEEQPWYVRLSG